MYLSKDEFFELRLQRVKESASLYDLLTAEGAEPRFADRSGQIPCCFTASHPKRGDVRPSARYYPKGERDDHETYYCWVCTERPLDVIGFLQRARGISFIEALRELERKYNVRYDDIQLSPDIGKELDKMSRAKQQVDPKKMLAYSERLLLERKSSLGLKKFTSMCYFLDLIYHRHDEKEPSPTVARLEKWQAKLHSLVPPPEALDAEE